MRAKAKRGGRQRNETRGVTGGHRGVKWSIEARRGLAGQASGDARRTRGLQALNRLDHCSCDSVTATEPDDAI